MFSALTSTYLDQSYRWLSQTSSPSVKLFYLGLAPERENTGEKDVEQLGELKNKTSFVTTFVLLSTIATAS